MKHEAILKSLEGCRLPDWEKLPDFGMYMDQMITFVNRSFPGTEGRLDLTASMINNYVKAGIIDKPSGKKYSRDALAQLLMIVQLKLTTPMEGLLFNRLNTLLDSNRSNISATECSSANSCYTIFSAIDSNSTWYGNVS